MPCDMIKASTERGTRSRAHLLQRVIACLAIAAAVSLVGDLAVDYFTTVAGATTRHAPLRVEWFSTVANTLVFSALLLGLIYMATFVRRRYRVRAGLCVACGYDLRGTDHAACPECGNEVMNHK